ncbi:MAG: hypothetical protein M1837_004170 [Sclerophora amabilis]|nr:MAG: hypothetical protein M1837_004170 [Sclerophora amabilis]
MASLAKVGRLTDELITILTGLSEDHDRKKFISCRDFTSRTLRHHGHGRTDQFDIKSQLDGLDEKLRVLNEDALADALATRLEALWTPSSKWTPDILAFLLQLSDQPATKSRIEDLEVLKPPDPPPALTWAEIIANDPLDEKGIWDDIDYAAETSEDEDADISLNLSVATDDTRISAFVGEESVAHTDAHVVPVDTEALQSLQRGRYWESPAGPRTSLGHDGFPLESSLGTSYLTELQCIREVLFMLSGLPTSLFRRGPGQGVLRNEEYALRHTEQGTFEHILGFFRDLGERINILRQWTMKMQSDPLMQTFKAAVEVRLGVFDKDISEYQGQLGEKASGVVISLLQTEQRMKLSSRPLVLLSNMISDADYANCDHDEGFKSLELLYDYTCSAQMSGNDTAYHFLAKLFFECFQTYLQPMENWMLNGELRSSDCNLFITKNERAAKDLGSLWHDQYTLRKDVSGKVHAPNFLHAASIKIFNAGKSIIFLQNLGDHDVVTNKSFSPDLDVNYETVVGRNPYAELAPFTEEFDQTLNEWISSRQRSTSLSLRKHLFSTCGLWHSLDALEYVYFLRDGALFGTVATTIFDKIDHGRDAWNDRFLLTELIQGTYSNLECVDTSRLSVRSDSGRYNDIQNRRRSVKVLGSMKIEYTLPWQICNIIRPKSLASYQRIFTFLLQIRRVQYTLCRLRLLKDDSSPLDGVEASLFYSIRHRLLWHANVLYNYLITVVLAPCTAHMRECLAAAEDLDTMISIHERYISRLEDQALLSKRLAPIHQAIVSILDLGILLSDAHAAYAGERNFDVTNRSISVHSGQLLPRSRRAGRHEDVSSDDEDDTSDEGGEADTSYISFQETPYNLRLLKMREQFERLCGFVRAGLRGVARAGGESSCWDTLAESLELGNSQTGQDAR